MDIKDFLAEIKDEVKTVNASDFKIKIYDTNFVPKFDDSLITYDNLDDKVKHCKRLESCVLYVDIRDSTSLSASKRPHTLARIYSSFVRSMIAAARHKGGHVRNIIGDRVMVVFDKEDCFTDAVNTAVLMNTIAHHIVAKQVTGFEFKCGIGTDYGAMLVTKAGAVRRGSEKEFYRSLVWLGRPANVASRLTDMANKSLSETIPYVREGYYYKNIDEWVWVNYTYDDFLDRLKPTYDGPLLKHDYEHFLSFHKTSKTYTKSFSPILMTNEVYQGYKQENPDADSVKNGWWREQDLNISEYNGSIYGGSIFFSEVNDL